MLSDFINAFINLLQGLNDVPPKYSLGELCCRTLLRGRTALRTKSVNTLCIKDLFTLKIEKNIPNTMAQTRVS